MAETSAQWDVRDVNSIDKGYKKVLQTGDEALQKKNYGYAIMSYRKVLKKYPALTDIRMKLREAQFMKIGGAAKISNQLVATVINIPKLMKGPGMIRSGSFADALDNAEQAMSVDPTATVSINLLAKACEASELLDHAVQTLEWGIKFHPKNQSMLLWLAECYKANEQAVKAVEIYQTLKTMSPGNNNYQELFREAGALASMEKGRWTELEKDNGDFKTVMRDRDQAEVLEQEGRTVRTEEGLQKLIAEQLNRIKDANTVDNNRHLAELLAEAKRYQEALDQYQLTIDMSDAVDPVLERAVTDLRSKVLEKTLGELKATLAETEDEADQQALETEIAALQSSINAMRIESLQDRVRRSPNAYEDRMELAELLIAEEKFDDALEHYQQIVRNPRFRKQATIGMGLCFMHKRVFDLAVEQFKSLIDDDARNMDAMKKDACYMLASCYREMGKDEDALKYLKMIYSVDSRYRDVKQLVEEVYGQAS